MAAKIGFRGDSEVFLNRRTHEIHWAEQRCKLEECSGKWIALFLLFQGVSLASLLGKGQGFENHGRKRLWPSIMILTFSPVCASNITDIWHSLTSVFYCSRARSNLCPGEAVQLWTLNSKQHLLFALPMENPGKKFKRILSLRIFLK